MGTLEIDLPRVKIVSLTWLHSVIKWLNLWPIEEQSILLTLISARLPTPSCNVLVTKMDRIRILGLGWMSQQVDEYLPGWVLRLRGGYWFSSAWMLLPHGFSQHLPLCLSCLISLAVTWGSGKCTLSCFQVISSRGSSWQAQGMSCKPEGLGPVEEGAARSPCSWGGSMHSPVLGRQSLSTDTDGAGGSSG